MSYHERYPRKQNSRDYDRNKDSKHDDPPHSRLFIVCGKAITEDIFRQEFSKFGSIEEVWLVKDRVTDEPKGVVYIKFSKTSEAALAMEEMNGTCIADNPRPLKVLIAHSRDQGSRRDTNEEERLLRLFVVVPKPHTESEMREHFKQFGDLDYVSIVRDKSTKESKGYGYVKYHKMSNAAKAFENCDRMYKPVFAEPKPQNNSMNRNEIRDASRMSMDHFGGGQSLAGLHSAALDSSGLTGDGTRLTVSVSSMINQDLLWGLFDLVPGLDYCEIRKDRMPGQSRNIASVVYNNLQSATYACDKLNGFQYPPGQRIGVKFENMRSHHSSMGGSKFESNHYSLTRSNASSNNGAIVPTAPSSLLSFNQGNNIQQDLATQLAETIAQATSLIQAAGLQSNNAVALHSSSGGEVYDPSLCSVKLPPPHPLASVDSEVAQRLFIVCQPQSPPSYAMKDVFGRFGSLIDIYILNGKTYGYAKYASRESAEKAIQTLHGQEVMGARLKVMEADPARDGGRKRAKLEYNDFILPPQM